MMRLRPAWGHGMQLAVHSLPIPDVKIISGLRFQDARGYFRETFSRDDLAAQGLASNFIQDNESYSLRAGTVRGLHFQREPFAQAKLVRVVQGRILDVVVDVRPASPTLGQYVSFELSAADDAQLLVPAGFAHGFCTLVPNTVVFYKVDNAYSPAHEAGINWADEDLAIRWPATPENATLSEKDRRLPAFKDLFACA